ncbi:MAG: PQQ-like beta-propeller repeat protein [Pirellulales bacterium]|nr:PQQ-like beta-propeller repeat protein [Pirellulales bacterium]
MTFNTFLHWFASVPPCCGLVLILLTSVSFAEDWPQAQGSARDNKSAETGLLDTWPKGGPELAWTSRECGIGYSGPAVVGDRVYIMGGRNGRAELMALDVSSGKLLWSKPVNKKVFDFEGNSWGAGPRATPTVADERIYALAGDGELAAFDVEGTLKWQVNMVDDLGGSVSIVDAGEPKTYGWGFCWSPLVDGDKVICVPGGERGMMAALDRDTGNVLWRSESLNEDATYSSPIKATVDGVDQYIVMTQGGMAGVSATDGTLLWNYERDRPYSDVVIPTPVYHDGKVYTSVGSAGCDLVELTKRDGGTFDAEQVYFSRNMKNDLGGFVLHDGHIYGTSDRRGWVCQDFKTGDLEWYSKRVRGSLSQGSIAYADGHLYLYAERGAEVALIPASTEGYDEKGRFGLPEKSKLQAPSGRNWTHPVIAGGKLYLRDQELLFCYKIQTNE